MGHLVVLDDSEAQFVLTHFSRRLWNNLAPDLPPSIEYEQCGTLWVAADEQEGGRYPVIVHEGLSPWEIDLRPLVKAAVEDLIAGRSPAIISARFHNTLAEVTVEVARAAAEAAGNVPIVLSGGCFQNVRLTESIVKPLRATNRVYIHHEVPPGDGGLALGQALVAAAVARRQAADRGSTSRLEVPTCV